MQVTRNSKLQIPSWLRQKMLAFRRRVWFVKMSEAVAGAAIGVLVGFLLTYTLDRILDTPQIVRGLIFTFAVIACALVPAALQRWVFRRRRMDQLARLLAETRPIAGDQLLGVIELSEDASEQSRSPELVEAAIQQVAQDVANQDLSDAVPRPRHQQRGVVAALLACVTLLLLFFTAAAARNAWARFLAPWKAIPRYTFASVEPLPEKLIVPHGEDFDFEVELTGSTQWQPNSAEVSLSGRMAKRASLVNGQYRFSLPGQIDNAELAVRVGDYQSSIPVEPVLRPELSSIDAEVVLPSYLGRGEPQTKQVRGSTMSVVRGSETVVTATASRALARATVNGQSRIPSSDQFSTDAMLVHDRAAIELQWEDEFGLSGPKPFQLTIEAVDDETPSLVCEDLPRRKVLLSSEVLSFRVRARDDFGVKKVGIEWRGLDDDAPQFAWGEKVIGAGKFDAEFLDLAGTFCAADEQIAPQAIEVRVYVEDYLPGRKRVYSPTSTFDVLDAQQHAIWITSQLSRWHQMSMDVRDREMQLHETNKQLRALPIEQLDRSENRQRLARQADLEKANGRSLNNLVGAGENLLKEAMRNPDIGVGHLDSWAEMMQILKDISGNRMPSVADLLKQAATAPTVAQKSPDQNKKQVGQNRLTQNVAGDPKQDAESSKPPKNVPTISDIESSHHELKADPNEKPSDPSKPKQSRLTLPSTMLAGNAKSDAKTPPSDSSLDDAVKEQKDLLAEFDKIADELSEVMANLEGSTLVKRLKASSRKQQQVASRLASLVSNSFGVSEREKDRDSEVFAELAEAEATSSQETSHIMDDMAAYFERSRYMLFRRVLDDMRDQDVTAGLRQLGDELRKENGLSISQAEYWSDTFDRWAEDLVEVTKCGACPGAKAKGSLPPSIVLEVLQLLEGEVKLREQTRVAEQARPAVTATEYMVNANQLSQTQHGFHERIDDVVRRILELPEAEADFANELGMLVQVSGVMAETVEILAKPDTGPPAIAAETEIIELLLKSKRFNPNAGGGGGSKPGGGGNGEAKAPALALVGAGVNDKEIREEMSATQTTGTTGPGLPEEFRSGLDQYFHRLESWQTEVPRTN